MAPLIQRRLNQGQSSSVEFRLRLYVAEGTLDAVSWLEPHFEEHWHLFGDNANILDNRYQGYLIGWLKLTIWKGNLFRNFTSLHNGVQEGTEDCSHDSDALTEWVYLVHESSLLGDNYGVKTWPVPYKGVEWGAIFSSYISAKLCPFWFTSAQVGWTSLLYSEPIRGFRSPY